MNSHVLCPARVNPVLKHPSEQRLSLEGQWQFRLDPDDRGLAERCFEHPDAFSDPIMVPGCWQGQGFGHDGEDEVWDFRLKARTFRATYKGTGWYARPFRVPSEWTGRRVQLKFGGAHPSAEVWLNGVRLGENDLPFVPFGFDVTQVVRVDADNDLVVRVHEKHREFGLAYNWQGNWSGLYRGVELTATGEQFLEYLRLYPEVDAERLRIRVRIGGFNNRDRPLQLRITAVPVVPVPAEIPVHSADTTFEVAVPSPRLWSPDTPNLYRVDAVLMEGERILDAESERVGFVKLAADGNKFLINGEPYYIRGTGDFAGCPETGCPDTDRDRWRRKLRVLRDYGYNQVRCQSYVYPPEYFDAADEVGLLIQSEMGMLGAWGGHSPWHAYQWPPPTPDNYPILKRQWDLTVARDVNHPSANIYCMSNELCQQGNATFFPKIAWQCYRHTKTLKPTAMVIWTDGGYNPDLPGDFVNDVTDRGDAGRYGKPVIEHEFKWWSAFPDVRISQKYTGAMRPYAVEIAREAVRRQGQEHLLETYAENSQRLQFLEAKVKMEMRRRDRACLAGISHFNAMDVGLSPQGIVDEFYERKLVDSATWRQTNGDTVVLSGLGIADRVRTAGREFRCAVSVSDFSHPPLKAPVITWCTVSSEGVLGSGEMTWQHTPYTTCPAGEVVWQTPEGDHPQKVRLEAELREGDRVVTNAWDLWLFPDDVALPRGVAVYGNPEGTWLRNLTGVPNVSFGEPDGIHTVLSERLDQELVDFMHGGGTVFLAALEGMVRPHRPNFGYMKYFFTPPANYGPFEDGQNGTVVRDHPMLGDFPHEGFAHLAFFRIIHDAPPLDLAPLGLNDADPVLRVIHRYPVCRPLGYLLERRCGKGSLILCALDLDPSLPEARYLLAQICEYAGSEAFGPAEDLSEETLKRLKQATALLA